MSLRASRIMLLYQLLKMIIKARPNCESIIARLDIGIDKIQFKTAPLLYTFCI
jgi:hypothetical protein